MFKYMGRSFCGLYMIYRKPEYMGDFFIMDDFGNAISVPFFSDWE